MQLQPAVWGGGRGHRVLTWDGVPDPLHPRRAVHERKWVRDQPPKGPA
jgi:hypothetical protein